MLPLLLEWLQEHLYAVVLVGAAVDALGVPFPGRIMLITVGSFAHPASEAEASVWVLIGLATVGTVVGDHAWYLVGRLNGRRLLQLYRRVFRLSGSTTASADRLLRRFGGLALVLARLAAALRAVIMPLAVSRGMSYPRFLAFDALGAVLWTAAFVGLGRAAGAVGSASGVVTTTTVLGVLVLASAVLSILARRRLAVGSLAR